MIRIKAIILLEDYHINVLSEILEFRTWTRGRLGLLIRDF